MGWFDRLIFRIEVQGAIDQLGRARTLAIKGRCTEEEIGQFEEAVRAMGVAAMRLMRVK